MSRPFKYFTSSEWLLVAAIVALFLILVASFMHKERVEMPKAYRAWVKQTGNTNDLSFDEWRSLVRANKSDPSTVFIYMGK